MKIYLDCDGVLADFVGGAKKALGMDIEDYRRINGLAETWKILEETPDFYANLDRLPDADELVHKVMDIWSDNLVIHDLPIILTACPWGDWAAPQKQLWKKKYYPYLEMITTDGGENKYHHCTPDDILIDDYLKYKDLWEQAGGIFLHHINTKNSLMLLEEVLSNYNNNKKKLEKYDDGYEWIGGRNPTSQ